MTKMTPELFDLIEQLKQQDYRIEHKTGSNRFTITPPGGGDPLTFNATGAPDAVVARLKNKLADTFSWVDTVLRDDDDLETRFKKLEAARTLARQNNPDWDPKSIERAERQARRQLENNRITFSFEYVDAWTAFQLLAAHNHARLQRGLPEDGVELDLQSLLNGDAEVIRQRRLSEDYRDNLGNTISLGYFLLTHQGVAIAEDGYLLDGQHRLHAVLETGCPIAIVIARGVPNDVIAVIDTGKRRTDSDVWHMNGFPNGNQISAVIRLLWWYDNEPDHTKWFNSKRRISELEVFNLFRNEYPTIIDTHRAATKLRHHNADVSLTVLSALYYLTTRADPDAPIEDFWNTMDVGPFPEYWQRLYPDHATQRQHPAYAFRTWANGWADRPRQNRKRRNVEYLIMALRAYNAARRGETLKSALFKPSFAVPTPYTPR